MVYMGGLILYFAFSIINVILFFILDNIYKKMTGGWSIIGWDISDYWVYTFAIILSGPFATIVLFLLGLHILNIWLKKYRKK